MKKILLYSDAKHLGGHELQTFNALQLLQDKYEIVFIVFKENKNFIELLNTLNIKIIQIEYSSNRFQILRTFFSLIHIYRLIKIIKELKPNLILNIQGNIELGSVMLLASKILKVKNITYIPICHKLSEVTHNGWIAKIKDFLNVFYYKMPDAFITLNDFNRHLIKQRGVSKPIYIILNGIDFNKYAISDKVEAKNKLGLDSTKTNVALIGRIQFWHKGHDILITMVKKYTNQLENYKFIIVGTGEDEEKMKNTLKDYKIENKFLFLGHQKDLSLIYSAIDRVVIPSRFESGAGTPMVLLESLYYEIPTVMTNLPDVDLYLEKESFFEKENIDELFKKLILTENKKIDFDKKNKIVDMHCMVKFQKNFFNVIEENVK